ncbi:hypothetical protein GF361_04525 [Candidatus Woesearchaeota archaeon]|nr:hypothetical protein [Candidatus Woesearchaeota archaeon]
MTYYRQLYKKRPSFAQEYEKNKDAAKNDFTRFILDKRMKKSNLPSKIYGYTFLGLDYMVINDNLSKEKEYETKIHESIHTPDEYETRLLTWWMIKKIKKEDLNNKENYKK